MGYIIQPNDVTVIYEEFEGSPQINLDNEGRITVKRIFKIAWSDMWTFAKQLLGWSEEIGRSIVIHEPHKYKPEGLLGYCVAVEIENIRGWPFGTMVSSPSSTSMTEYNYALFDVRYEVPTWFRGEDDEPIISESIEPAAEFLTLSSNKLYWDMTQTDGITDTEAPSFAMRLFDWVYTLHFMPYIPSTLLDKVGHVNSTVLYSRSLNLTFPAGTVLLGNPSSSRQYTGLGIGMWEVTVRLTVRQIDWNLFPRPSLGGVVQFKEIYNDAGTRVYPYTFSDLSTVIL